MPTPLTQLPEILAGLVSGMKAEFARAAFRAEQIFRREAVANAPRSPTAAQNRASREAKWAAKGKRPSRAQKAAWKARRNPRATSREKPGGLENSIRSASGVTPQLLAYAEVFVPSGVPAARYAVRIHDEKGRTWRNRGVGTVAKGSRADEKFISRARDENAGKYEAIFSDAMGKVIDNALR